MTEEWTSLDYSVWILMTMDDEESRILEAPDDYLNSWRESGVPDELMKDLEILVREQVEQTSHEDWRIESARWSAILAILKYYVSHLTLFERHYNIWERQFWKYWEKL